MELGAENWELAAEILRNKNSWHCEQGTGNWKSELAMKTRRYELGELEIGTGAASRQLKIGGAAGSGKQIAGGTENRKLRGVQIGN